MAKGLRPAKCYKWDTPAYTRVAKNPSNSYITGIPGSKLLHYDMGNKTEEFDYRVQLVPDENIILRHNCLESARIMIQKTLEGKLGVVNYFFKINVFPHHVIRENVMATGAGADRVQDGMRKSFGKPMGRAARVKKGQPVFTVTFNNNELRLKIVRDALKAVKNKLPGTYTLNFTKVSKKEAT